MAKGNAPASTPALKKSTSSGSTQKTLHGFFTKTPSTASTTTTMPERSSPRKNKSLQKKMIARVPSSQLTPVPSSDGPEEQEAAEATTKESSTLGKGLPSPVSSANDGLEGQTNGATEELTMSGTPSRRVSFFNWHLGHSMLI